MNIGEYSIKKKTVTLVLTVMASVGGMLAYNNLGRLEDPEFTIKAAMVLTRYPGASAEELEREVTNEIEKACGVASTRTPRNPWRRSRTRCPSSPR